MKYGIYYAYWAKRWGVDYRPYVARAAQAGFDYLEVSCAGLKDMSPSDIAALKQCADDHGIGLTGGYGPKPEENISSADVAIAENGIRFWKETFPVMEKLGITVVGGGLYGYWPVDYSKPIDKAGDLERGIRNMKRLSKIATDYGITTLGMEVLNRHEGYMLNTAKEALAFVEAVDCPNVKIHLDTYHMLLEEDDFVEAIHTAGTHLGHFHVGENNRRLPGQGNIIPWKAIGQALKDVHYEGAIVTEPFVIDGGEVGRDIRVWRKLLEDTSDAKLDQDAAESVKFMHSIFD